MKSQLMYLCSGETLPGVHSSVVEHLTADQEAETATEKSWLLVEKRRNMCGGGRWDGGGVCSSVLLLPMWVGEPPGIGGVQVAGRAMPEGVEEEAPP
ncbi:Hypothetical predicted protein [Olea europaea subsp. europaea]|uniref:Uncharacterized protein n=1 Tax=Olea europaea subsp. europaea TaxID=158383 RepID=A0A8S0T9Y9_OLEEU|nr:Hypothetical predicted protein [Olea europaea subsp. europaea]